MLPLNGTLSSLYNEGLLPRRVRHVQLWQGGGRELSLAHPVERGLQLQRGHQPRGINLYDVLGALTIADYLFVFIFGLEAARKMSN